MEIGGLTNILKFFNFFLFISNIEKKKIEKKNERKDLHFENTGFVYNK